MKKADLTGSKFTHLTVLERVPAKGWKVRCDCGNKVVVPTGQLTSGNKKSCGRTCSLPKNRGFQAENLLGKRFGHLVVSGYNPQARRQSSGAWEAKWVCTCDCGNSLEVSSHRLTHNKTTSCGCQASNKVTDLTNQRFGKLLVIARAENSENGSSQWLCRCDCGEERVVRSYKLTSKQQISCGCSKKETKPSLVRVTNQQISFQPNREILYEKILTFCSDNSLKLLTPREEFINLRRSYEDNIKLECVEKGHTFSLRWNNLKVNGYCRKCHQFKSQGELEVRNFVLEHFPEHEVEVNIKNLVEGVNEVDILIRPLNFCIEYNGLYWHSKGDPRRHLEKREKLEAAGYSCFQLNADEWEEKKEIVKSMLRSRFQKTERSVYARHCKIRELGQKEADQFLKATHLMGPHQGSSAIGLYLASGEIVAVMTYRVLNGGKVLEVSRFSSALHTQVIGGMTKLLKAAMGGRSVEKVISWVDLRYGTGKSLTRNGFHCEKVTLGWKWTDCNRTYNRLRCRANMDERKLPEREYAKELGWSRIYDAGQALFVRMEGK